MFILTFYVFSHMLYLNENLRKKICAKKRRKIGLGRNQQEDYKKAPMRKWATRKKGHEKMDQ